MYERIKKLRKALDLTQQKFADCLGMKQNTIATYEMGRSIPSDPTIKSICREFNVNETWLRTGAGEMFVQRDREGELALMVQKLLSGESSEFKTRFISVLAGLKEEQWVVLEEKMNEIIGSHNDPPAAQPLASPPAAPSPDLTPTLAQELVELKRQNQDIMRQNQELATEIATLKGNDSKPPADDAWTQELERAKEMLEEHWYAEKEARADTGASSAGGPSEMSGVG